MSSMDDLTAQTDGLKTHAREALHKAADQLAEHAYHLRDLAADARYNSEDFIQTKPWQSVFIAGGIGFLVGVLVARR